MFPRAWLGARHMVEDAGVGGGLLVSETGRAMGGRPVFREQVARVALGGRGLSSSVSEEELA